MTVWAGHSLWWLEDVVRSLSESHKEMEQSIKLQRIILQNAIMYQVVYGGGLHEEELEFQLRYVGIELDGDWFCGALIRMDQDHEWDNNMSLQGDLRRTQLIYLLSEIDPRLVYMGLYDQNTCAVVYVGQNDEETNETVFRRLYQQLIEMGETETLISVGSKQQLLTTLYYSFQMARQQMERAENGSWLLTNRSQRNNNYHFSQRDEQRLTNFIIHNKQDEADELLKHLWDENFCKRNIIGFERELLFFRIIDTIIKAVDDSTLFSNDQTRMNELEAKEFFILIREKIKQACNRTNEKRTEQMDTLLTDIIAYLEKHYSNYETSLTTVAMYFGITEKYLSSFFKQKAGINFSTYLENIRVQKATEYLQLSTMTIEEISKDVGYSSAKSFSRAYYRATGQTPSQARV